MLMHAFRGDALELVHTFTGPADPVRELRWLPTGHASTPTLMALGRDDVVRLWHPPAAAITVRGGKWRTLLAAAVSWG